MVGLVYPNDRSTGFGETRGKRPHAAILENDYCEWVRGKNIRSAE